jgi:hypothetical protein
MISILASLFLLRTFIMRSVEEQQCQHKTVKSMSYPSLYASQSTRPLLSFYSVGNYTCS